MLYHALVQDEDAHRHFYLYRLFRIHRELGTEDKGLSLLIELYRAYPQYSEAQQARAEARADPSLDSAFRSRWTMRDDLQRVDRLIEAGQTRTAQSEVATLSKQKSLDPHQRRYLDLKRAQALLAEGHLDAARSSFESLQKVDLLRREAQFGLAQVHAKKGNEERVRALLWDLVTQPGPGDLKARAAEILHRSLQRQPDRVADLSRLYVKLAADPDVRDRSFTFRWRAAMEAMSAGETAMARDLLLQIRGAGEERWHAPAILYWVGRLSETLGETEQARASVQQLMDQYPLSYYAYLAQRPRDGLQPASRVLPPPPKVTDLWRPDPAADPSCMTGASPAATRYLERANRMGRLGLEDLARLELRAFLDQKDDPAAIYLAYDELSRLRQYATVIFDGKRRFSTPQTPSDLPCEGLWRYLYPRGYRQFVSYMAEKQSVDPNLMYALIREESTFNPRIVSPANARGLMQLIPSTARIVQRQTGLTFMRAEDLFDPYFNVKLGVTHVRDLIAQYDGSAILALAAYNAGPGNVSRWMAQRTYQDDAEFAELIPFTETNNYVKKVLSAYQVYAWLYRPQEAVVRYD